MHMKIEHLTPSQNRFAQCPVILEEGSVVTSRLWKVRFVSIVI